MTNANRRALLERYKKGEVTLQEVERRLDMSPAGPPAPDPPRRVYVRVTEGGVKKTDIKLPFSLVRAGLQLGKSFGILGARYDLNTPVAKTAIAALSDVDADKLLAGIKAGEITLPYHIVDIDDSEAGKPGTRVVVVLK